MLAKRCANDNHGRSVVTVRFCSTCGVIVNGRVAERLCSELSHARSRRSMNAYCVDCGESLKRR